MPHLIRRSFLAGSAGAALGAMAPAVALGAAPRGADGNLRKELDGFVGELLAHAPETATQLGLDHGASAARRATPALSSGAAQSRNV
mgnify:CR=1 FL=1